MKAAEVMTPRVLTVDQDAPLGDAIALMLKNGISGIPVVDDAKALTGMLTEGDLLRRAETGTERKRSRWLEFLIGPDKLASEYIHTHSRRVREVMTPKVISVTPDTPLEDVVQAMEHHHIKRLPVVKDGKLVGIVSRANLLQALFAVARQIPDSTASDDAIRAKVWEELNKAQWAPAGLLNVLVRDGVVYLHGMVTMAHECEALRVAAENVPGVKAVHSQLTWLDTLSGTAFELPEEDAKAPGGKHP